MTLNECLHCSSKMQTYTQSPYQFEWCPECKYWEVDLVPQIPFDEELFDNGMVFGGWIAQLMENVGKQVTVISSTLSMTGTLLRASPNLDFTVATDLAIVCFTLKDVRSMLEEDIYLRTPVPAPAVEVSNA